MVPALAVLYASRVSAVLAAFEARHVYGVSKTTGGRTDADRGTTVDCRVYPYKKQRRCQETPWPRGEDGKVPLDVRTSTCRSDCPSVRLVTMVCRLTGSFAPDTNVPRLIERLNEF